MTKVWKRTGAVAVFSPARAILVCTLIVAVIAAAGFAVGIAVAGDDTTPRTAEQPSPDTRAAYAPDAVERTSGGRRAIADAYRRGYRKGRRRGAAAARGASAPFEPNSAFIVRYGRSPDDIVRRVQVQAGETYWLCAGGTRLCIR